jgi:hypothetical protein
MTRKNHDKPPHVQAAQKGSEAQRTAKDTRSPGRLRGQGLLFETDFQGRLWGVQKGKGNK